MGASSSRNPRQLSSILRYLGLIGLGPGCLGLWSVIALIGSVDFKLRSIEEASSSRWAFEKGNLETRENEVCDASALRLGQKDMKYARSWVISFAISYQLKHSGQDFTLYENEYSYSSRRALPVNQNCIIQEYE